MSGPPPPAPDDGAPPPPPPDDGDGPAPAEHAERYIAYLRAAGRPTDSLHEEVGLRVGEWRFFYRGDSRPPLDAAGLDADGHAVTGFAPGDWYHFLSTPDLDADGAHRRIAWLLGRPGPVGPGYRWDDPRVAERVGAPVLTQDSAAATFAGWVIYPPEMQSPHRLSITAQPGSPASIGSTLWSAAAD